MRFLGRKVYAALTILLVSASGEAETCAPPVIATTPGAPSWATRRRYRFWWAVEFFQTPWFVEMAGRFAEPVVAVDAPASLLERFVGSLGERVTGLLRGGATPSGLPADDEVGRARSVTSRDGDVSRAEDGDVPMKQD